MHAVFSNLMSGMLFVHAVLGCCWHHTYDCAAPDCASHLGDRVAQPVGCCGAEHDDDHGSPGDSPHDSCPSRHECRGVCTYLRPEKFCFRADAPETSPVVAALPSTLDRGQTLMATRRELAAESVAWAPPLRRHLLQQLLLI